MSEGFKLEEFETKSEKMKRRQNNTALVHSTVRSLFLLFFLYPIAWFRLTRDLCIGFPRGVQYHPSLLES